MICVYCGKVNRDEIDVPFELGHIKTRESFCALLSDGLFKAIEHVKKEELPPAPDPAALELRSILYSPCAIVLTVETTVFHHLPKLEFTERWEKENQHAARVFDFTPGECDRALVDAIILITKEMQPEGIRQICNLVMHARVVNMLERLSMLLDEKTVDYLVRVAALKILKALR